MSNEETTQYGVYEGFIPYSTLVPANNAWFPADRTEVRMTVFIIEAAAAEWPLSNSEEQSKMGLSYMIQPT
jgi:hypothetical protein